jgi:hypothetical protein
VKVASGQSKIFNLVSGGVLPGGFSTSPAWFRIVAYFSERSTFSALRIEFEISGKCKFLLTLSGGDGLLSHSAFLQATH